MTVPWKADGSSVVCHRETFFQRFFWSIRFKKCLFTNYCQNVNKSMNEVLNLFYKFMENGLKWDSVYKGNLAGK